MSASGPCSYFLCAEDLPASGDCIEMVSHEVIDGAITEASYLLWKMSGGRMYGVCEATIRPTKKACVSLRACDDHCSQHAIVLPETPVQRVRWVMIDGEVIPPNEYRIEGGDTLLRIGDMWPHCQHLDRRLTEEGTFGIRYRYGHEVDPVTKRAAVDLALEFIKLAAPGERARRLPGAVTNASSQGLSFTVQDRNLLARTMGSHIESVNRFMSVWNPRVDQPAYVYSPDTSPSYVVLDGMG